MSAPQLLTEFSTPIAGPAGKHVSFDHPRFTQIQCHLEGTHPDVQVGQVWEDLDLRKGGRHVLVNSVNTDGTTNVVTVYVGTTGKAAKMGHLSVIATHRFRVLDGGRGFRLRAVLVSLTDAGVPVNPETVPVAKTLSSMVAVDKKPPAPPAKTYSPSTVVSKDKAVTPPIPVKDAATLNSQGRQIGALLTDAKSVPTIMPFHARLGIAVVATIGFEDAKEFAATVDASVIPATGSNAYVARMSKAAKQWKHAKDAAARAIAGSAKASTPSTVETDASITVETDTPSVVKASTPSVVTPRTVKVSTPSKALVTV